MTAEGAFATNDYPLYPATDVLPHSPPMVLLDRILDWRDGHLRAELTIRPDAPFAAADGVPAWAGLEYMAQAIAAYAGCRARREHQPVRIGFLVGTRRYSCNRPSFPLGATLRITVDELLQGQNDLSVFQCTLNGTTDDAIDGSGGPAGIEASANLNVFHPRDPVQFLRGESRD